MFVCMCSMRGEESVQGRERHRHGEKRKEDRGGKRKSRRKYKFHGNMKLINSSSKGLL